ncbi:MAG: Sua5/YciO/YrdC/YwlC family protein [Candidatus Pacearchaeota archaeon]
MDLRNTKANKKIVEKYLPGKYTLILKKKRKNFLKHVSPTEFIGVRIPNNNFCKIIQLSKVPFITTSVNISGKPFAKSLKEINKEILNKVDVIIDAGKLSGKPSIIVFYDGKELKR